MPKYLTAGLARRVLAVLPLELRATSRSFRREPYFAIGVILTLVIGSTSLTSVASIGWTLFAAGPAGVRAPATVRRLFFRSNWGARGEVIHPGTSYPAYVDLASQPGPLSHVSAFVLRDVVVESSTQYAEVRAAFVSENYFDALGVVPVRGRLFTPTEARLPDAAPVAVVSSALAHRLSDDNGTAEPLRIGHRSYTVIGVLPAAFRGVDMQAVDLWLPLENLGAIAGLQGWEASRGGSNLNIFARAGTSSEALINRSNEFTLLTHPAMRKDDNIDSVLARTMTSALQPDDQSRTAATEWLLLVGTMLFLLSVANVTYLFASRAVSRRRDSAIWRALAGGRTIELRRAAIEGMMLGATSLAVALMCGPIASALLIRSLFPESTNAQNVGIGMAPAGICAVLIVVAAVCAALLGRIAARVGRTASLASHMDVHVPKLKLMRFASLAVQLTLTIALLTQAVALGISSRDLMSADRGFDAAHLLTLRPDVSPFQSGRSARVAALKRIFDEAPHFGGVAGVALASAVPLGNPVRADALSQPGSKVDLWHGERPYEFDVSPGYGTLLGLRIVSGRFLSQTDAPPVGRGVVVDEQMARVMWPGRRAVGQCVYLSAQSTHCFSVVGVVKPVAIHDIREAGQPQFYLPLGGDPASARVAIIATRNDVGASLEAIRSALRRVAPGLPYLFAEPLSQPLDNQLRPLRDASNLCSACSIAAVLIALAGVLTAVAYSVARRTREIGTRVALGASPAHIAQMFGRELAASVIVGCLGGVSVSAATERLVAALLVGVRPTSGAVVVTVVCCTLALCAFGAIYPIRSALRREPSALLREA